MVIHARNFVTSDDALGEAVIGRSLKFNKGDSPHLYRTVTSQGNTQQATFSCWVKRTNISVSDSLILMGSNLTSGNNQTSFGYQNDDVMAVRYRNSSGSGGGTSARKFRDVSSWHHLVYTIDTTQSSSSNRQKLYVNGDQDTITSSNNNSHHDILNINKISSVISIGALYYGGSFITNRGDFYLAEVNFVDGQSLDPSSFGFTDPVTGIWRPKKFIPNKINNGTTWSSNATTSNLAGGNIADVFDGDTYDSATINSSDASNNHFTLSSVNVNASKVTVYVSNSGSDITVYINGSSVGTVSSGDMTNNVSKPFSFTFTETIVSTIKVQRGGSTSGWLLYGISLDDVMLIDGNTSNIGVNGFRLDFSDNSSAAALGTDRSNNGNDLTVSGISVSSGVGNDSVIDTPTNNFATLNRILKGPRDNGTESAGTFSEGNLKLVLTGTGDDFAGTMSVSSGKWYHEVKLITAQNHGAGWTLLDDFTSGDFSGSNSGIVNEDGHLGTGEYSSGSVIVNNGSTSAASQSFTNDDILGFAFNIDDGSLQIYRNGTLISTITGIAAGTYVPIVGDDSSTDASFEINFGQRPFSHTQPTGYRKLCSKNLPSNVPSVIRPQKHFDTILYTGDNTTSRKISGLEFKPDFVWIKPRSFTSNHCVLDSVRGVHNRILPNSSGANVNNAATITSFNADGFQIGNSSLVNTDSATHAAWCWKAGGNSNTFNIDGVGYATAAAAGLDEGTANPTGASVNTEAGFSIIEFEAQSSGDITLSHGLGKKPEFWMWKSVDNNIDWYNYHKDIGYDGWVNLSTNSTVTTGNDAAWGAEPTSTVFTHGSGLVNQNTIIMYIWTSIPGYSKIGSYIGNGSSDGQFVHTGFRPAFIILKNLNTVKHWGMYDNKRAGYNVENYALFPSDSSVEDTDDYIDLVSNGFKIRSTALFQNKIGNRFIYIALAEQPGTTPFGMSPNAR